MEGIVYGSGDVPDQTLSLYLPSISQRKSQTLLLFEGEGFPELVQKFAGLGYPVIAFNIRSENYLVEIQDSFCALAWVHANADSYGFDANGIIPIGGSMWGGNAAILGLVDDPEPFLEECPYTLPDTGRVRAVIALAGVFDYSEEGDFFAGFIPAISDYMGGTPEQVPENWATASAINWVQGDEPPFLLVHGLSDTNVAPHQSEIFAAALEGVGTEVELVLVPGVNHSGSVRHKSVFEAVQSYLERLEQSSKEDSDSGLIVFYSERDGNAELYTMNPDGSDQHRLTFNSFDDVAPIWSPDGSRIAFLSNRDDPDPGACFPECFYQLYMINADGSEEHLLVRTEMSVHHPDWHPHGSKISFDAEQGFQGNIYQLNVDGSGLELLIEDGFWADWSPDGSQIVFASNRDGNLEIYLADADGGNQRRLTNNQRRDFFPAWSPDGERIAFMAGVGRGAQLFIMNTDGSSEQQLTTKGSVNEDPAWSPDGSQIVFQSNQDGNFEIYTLNLTAFLDGSGELELRRLTETGAGDYWPIWGTASVKPDESSQVEVSNLIAFVSTRDGNGEIYVMGSDGSQPERLTNWRLWDGYPAWSPDGKRIAYYSYLAEKEWVIKVMDSDGSNQDQLTNNHVCDGAPRWSPDGNWIAYSSDPDCSAKHREIVIMANDGAIITNLTSNEFDDMGASWSPDSQQIVFSSDRDGDYDIYIMDVDGSNVYQLTKNELRDYMPAWSPDGSKIAYVSNIDGNDEIYVMDLNGGTMLRLTNASAADWFPEWSPDGTKLLFSSQRDGNLEIYVMEANGNNIERLTNHPSDDFNAVWQPSSE